VNRADLRADFRADRSASAMAASVMSARWSSSAWVTPVSPVAELNDRGGADRFLFEWAWGRLLT
jgi:hypothetical protein